MTMVAGRGLYELLKEVGRQLAYRIRIAEPPVDRPTPPVVSVPPTPRPEGFDASVIAWEAIRLVNLYRDLRGLRPLGVDVALVEAARIHARDMDERGYFSHISPEGRTWQHRAEAAGYRGNTLEVIAKGHRSEPEAFDGWMDSRGHERVLMDPNAEKVGIVGVGRIRVGMVGFGGGWPASMAVMLSPEPIEAGG